MRLFPTYLKLRRSFINVIDIQIIISSDSDSLLNFPICLMLYRNPFDPLILLNLIYLFEIFTSLRQSEKLNAASICHQTSHTRLHDSISISRRQFWKSKAESIQKKAGNVYKIWRETKNLDWEQGRKGECARKHAESYRNIKSVLELESYQRFTSFNFE